MTTKISMLAIDLAKGSLQVCAVGPDGSCVDVYGPRLIATFWVLVRRSRLRTYIRLLRAARCLVAASPDGFPRASSSMLPRHRRSPCRSTHQVQEAMGSIPFSIPARLLQCSVRTRSSAAYGRPVQLAATALSGW